METIESYSHLGAEMLYCDTDSVIFKCPRPKAGDVLSYKDQIFHELEVDNLFGSLKVEKKDHEIVTFASGGAKQYMLKVLFEKILKKSIFR